MNSTSQNGQNLQETATFFNGQRIEATDLKTLVARQRELRWQHNRTLHTWGIGSGLVVIGEKEARAALVGPGYAIDSMGREILLSESHTEPVPPVAGEDGKPNSYYLTISFPDQAGITTNETRDGICMPRGAVRLLETPVFCWVKIDEQGRPAIEVRSDIEEGRKIVLARAEVLNCKLAQPLSIRERRNSKVAAQPYIAAGNTPEKSTPWQLWKELNESGEEVVVGVQVDVDTSDAGFRQTPAYSARVGGNRFGIVQTDSGADLLLIEPIAHVENASAQQFRLRAMLIWKFLGGSASGAAIPYEEQIFLRVLRELLNWHVVWIGIEG